MPLHFYHGLSSGPHAILQRSSKGRLPPGPKQLPIIGSAHHIPLQYKQNTLAELGKKFGDVIYIRTLWKHTVVLNSVRAARELLEKRGSTYSDRPHFVLISELIEAFEPHLPLMPYGEQWRRHRKWFQMTLSTRVALDSYRPLQQREVVKFLANLLENPQGFASHLKRYAAGVLMEISYGHTVTSTDDEYIRMADKAMTEISELHGLSIIVLNFLPILKHTPTWLPGAGFKREALRLKRVTFDAMNIPFEIVKTEMAAGTAKPSFVRNLLLSDSQSSSDEQEIRASAAVIYLAGIDTTATLLTTLILAMVLNPQVYRKAQAEMDAVVGPARLPNSEDRPMLPYLECILKEALRWSCPAPIGVPHQVSQDDEYRGYHIPKGSTVISNIWAMSRDAVTYPDPEAFNPDRFREDADDTDGILDPHIYTFGFGRRICPGRWLADSSA
ncbi:cytochrome P450 [Laetiporus sulphureus 93-53]|uniref:Cytochrome P450 n=1 Tax=Laetiporus sulphureus 93-53 TaxID=1314785 RepID=A0A165CPG1_9APHY|nr:cytochrome P450 [Laetiporus sulphureus 93-53]KZT03180.1 cytochrome P450 [Laetiporus sulphureus 93-53]